MMSYGVFQDRETGRKLLIIVTHLDHQGTEARLQQARLIVSFLKKHSVPAVVMGDFNDRPGSRTHELLTSSDVGLYDTWQLLGKNEGEESMTHHGFSGLPQKTRMDWILVSSHFRARRARIIRDNAQGFYPSDHFPYLVDLEW
jgi:endonuclease/exonuclease/phosphatase family metal-dependent hydrolase